MEERNEYLVVSIVYSYLDRTSGIRIAQIGDFHLNENQLPGGRPRGKEETGSNLVNTTGDSPQIDTPE